MYEDSTTKRPHYEVESTRRTHDMFAVVTPGDTSQTHFSVYRRNADGLAEWCSDFLIGGDHPLAAEGWLNGAARAQAIQYAQELARCANTYVVIRSADNRMVKL